MSIFLSAPTCLSLCDFLHLCQNHRGHLFFPLDLRPASIIHHQEGPILRIRLDSSSIESVSDQASDIKNCVGGVHGYLILCRADQWFGDSKDDGTCSVQFPWLLGNYFHFPMLEDTHTILVPRSMPTTGPWEVVAPMWALLSLQRKQQSGELARGSMRSCCLSSFVLYSLEDHIVKNIKLKSRKSCSF